MHSADPTRQPSGAMSPGRVAGALLLARTVRHLRPAQVAHRARLRALEAAFERFPGPLALALRTASPHAGAGWPSGFAPLDRRDAAARNGERNGAEAEAVAEGAFTFLAEERSLVTADGGWDWAQEGAPRLWRFHLHGFEWAWSFTAHSDRGWASAQFDRVWRSWSAATTVGRGDAWSPYVASVRAWALCGLREPLLATTATAGAVASALAVHARFLRARLELDVGGNHLVKNLKALVGLGVFLDDEGMVGAATARMAGELARQVLPDGGHFERSPSYHCQVLGDLIDVADLLAAAGRAPVDGLDVAVASMRSWLGTILLAGGVPLFNDGAPVGRRRLALLSPDRRAGPAAGPAGRRAPTGAVPTISVLGASGYVAIGAGRIELVADVGLPCPPELPAHAHADCLSFQLAVDGRLVAGDTGTSTYAAGARRDYERSTAAHSTVEVDGEDQTEVWGAFRSARRARPALERAGLDGAGVAVLAARHDGYERLGGRPRHQRTWRVTAGRVEIVDEITGARRHRCVARLILAPGTAVEHLEAGRFRVGPVEILLAGGAAREEAIEVAPCFGLVVTTRCLALVTEGPLPHRLTTLITVAER